MASKYGINEDVVDSYRRTIVFNNSLLKRDYEERYLFRVDEEVKKMRAGIGRSKPVSEEESQKYVNRQNQLFKRRRTAYFKRLDDGVEPAVNAYVRGIKQALGLS